MEKTAKTVKAHTDSRGMTIILRGEIDHHNAAAWRADIDRMIREKRPQRVYLELGGIEFMDSSGLGLIMGRYALLKKLGGELVLRDPSEAVARICRLAGLERIIRTENTKKGE